MKRNLRDWSIFSLIITGLIAPPCLFRLIVLNAPSASPKQVETVLENTGIKSILIDVRSKTEFQKLNLKQSVNIPLEDISSAPTVEIIKDKEVIFVICDFGPASALAAKKLRGLGFSDAFYVAGGLDAWRKKGIWDEGSSSFLVNTQHGDAAAIPTIQYTLLEQTVITVAAFVIKPFYEVLSFILILCLWRKTDADWTALRRAMTAFFIGETACAVNFIFFNEQNDLIEYVHVYGMIVCFSFITYTLIKTIDLRAVKYSVRDKKCALLPLCGECYKYRSVSCSLRLIFLFAIPATAIVALMPLVANLDSYFFVGRIFFNDVVLGHKMLLQVIETRLCPLVALIFLGISFTVLFLQKERGIEKASLFYAMGMGALGFSLMRFITFWGYQKNPIWAESWEEITELLLVSGIFWIVFFTQYMPKKMAQKSASESTHD